VESLLVLKKGNINLERDKRKMEVKNKVLQKIKTLQLALVKESHKSQHLKININYWEKKIRIKMEKDLIVKVHQTQRKLQHLMERVLVKIVRIKQKELEKVQINQVSVKKVEIIRKVVPIRVKTNLDKKIQNKGAVNHQIKTEKV
jgi:hypothetical protein